MGKKMGQGRWGWGRPGNATRGGGVLFSLWASVSPCVHCKMDCILCNPETLSQTSDSPLVATMDSGVTDGWHLSPQPGGTAGLWGMVWAADYSRGRDLLLVSASQGCNCTGETPAQLGSKCGGFSLLFVVGGAG